MGLFELVALGAAVGVDTLSVSVGIGISGISRRRLYQFGSAFTVTTAALFALGCTLAIGLRHFLRLLPDRLGSDPRGRLVPEILNDQAGLVLSLLAAFILFGLGLQMMVGKGVPVGGQTGPTTVRGLWGLLWLCTLVSIDAVSAGLSLGMLNAAQAVQAVAVVGTVNGSMSFLGLGLGRRLRVLVNDKSRFLGGLVLIALSLRLLANLLY